MSTTQERIAARFRAVFPPPQGAHVFVAAYDRLDGATRVAVAEVWSTTNASSNPAVRERIASCEATAAYVGPAARDNATHGARHDHEEAMGRLLAALSKESKP